MVLSYQVATRSLDPSSQTGAVLISANGLHVIGTGFNHFTPGIDEKFWHGDKEDKYARVVHAEVSAILSAARAGNKTQGSIMVSPWAACSSCAKTIADAGISRLIRHPHDDNGGAAIRWMTDCLLGDEIMLAAGIEITEIAPIHCGIRMRRDGKLWPDVASH